MESIKQKNYLLLDFIGHTYVILVQSSMKVTNQRTPFKNGVGEGPDTSEWIIMKRTEHLLNDDEKEVRWLFTSLQVSQRKADSSTFHSQISSSVFFFSESRQIAGPDVTDLYTSMPKLSSIIFLT